MRSLLSTADSDDVTEDRGLKELFTAYPFETVVLSGGLRSPLATKLPAVEDWGRTTPRHGQEDRSGRRPAAIPELPVDGRPAVGYTDITMSELREFMRVSTAMQVELVAAGGTVTCTTRDVSMNGLFVVCNKPFPEGTTCYVSIALAPEATIAARGIVARSISTGMALHFTDVMGIDSFEHLRNLVLANSGDASTVEREIQAHLGIKRA